MRPIGWAAVAWLAMLAGHSPASAQEGRWTMYLRRVGPVHVGMSLSQVRAVLRDPAASLAGNTPGIAVEDCAYVRSTRLPVHVGLMFEHGRVVRFDALEAGIRTASGIEVGATEANVQAAYPGRIRIDPHKYDPRGHYLTYVAVDAGDKPFGLVFETDGQRVTRFRAGTVSAISLVEGCA
jgi:hypothetical protein